MMKKYWYIFSIILLPQILYSQQVDADRIDAYLDEIAGSHSAVGSVEIARNGQVLYQRDFGQISEGDTAKVKAYQVGSITKMMTAVMTYRLCENNKLALDQTTDQYLPRIPHADRITIAHLLGHVSGLKNYNVKNDSLYFWLTQKVGEEDILREIERQGVAFDPGEKTDYSNSAYFVLVKILEQQYDKPYPKILNDEIVVPLGLKSTYSNVGCSDGGYPKSYTFGEDKWMEVTDFWFPNIRGVGDVVSTPHDINMLLEALFGGSLISPKNVLEMKPSAEGHAFALGKGLMRFPFEDQTFYGHEGHTLGTHSIALYDEQDGMTMTLCINGYNKPMNKIAVNILCILYNKEYARQKLSL